MNTTFINPLASNIAPALGKMSTDRKREGRYTEIEEETKTPKKGGANLPPGLS